MDYWKEIETLISDLTSTNPNEAEELQILFNYSTSATEMLTKSVSILLSLKATVHLSIAAKIDQLEHFCKHRTFPKSSLGPQASRRT